MHAMMTAEKSLPLVSIEDFSGAKQTSFFKLLKQPRFSGNLVLSDTKGHTWTFQVYLGRLTFVTGGAHGFRSWKRQVLAHCPHLNPFPGLLKQALKDASDRDLASCWPYQILCLWVEQQKITREQAAKIVRALVVEALFDITQARQVTYQIHQSNSSNTQSGMQLALLDAEQTAAEAQEMWKTWQTAKLADRSPNAAPVIRQPKQLQEHTSPNLYQVLSKLLDGQRTLRDLAISMKRSATDVTRSLLPYVQQGFIELVELPDLPSPVQVPVTPLPVAKSAAGPLIACIDDSPLICQSMEEVIKGGNYQFMAINDPLRAIAQLMARKPALIFLDLIMPNANGYEICGQLRKLSIFKETPIVILTGQDGIVDRVRAKLVGASDFLSKPADAATVLGVIRKYVQTH
jgi:two-component system, chemotaxis family, response regulator PixG